MSRATRYASLDYGMYGGGWRFVDAETGETIGDYYRTEKELLADLHRFAAERGYN